MPFPTDVLGIAACLAAVGGLAFANGANDLPKGFATLVGSGASSYRSAQRVGLLATVAGAFLSMFLSFGLLRLFSTGGLTSVDPALEPAFPIAVVSGAALSVLLASRLGLPVSTTHAILGATLGAAVLTAGPGGVEWQTVALAAALPLLVGPLAAIFLGFGLATVSRRAAEPRLGYVRDRVHFLSAAAGSAARSLNDTPKIVGVGLTVLGIHGNVAVLDSRYLVVVLTAVTMTLGGWVAGRRVSHTLAYRVVDLDRDSGLAANSANAVLVTAGSLFGLPLSTTHVSGAALVGAGRAGRTTGVHRQVLGNIALAWLLTVPASALVAAATWLVVTLAAAIA